MAIHDDLTVDHPVVSHEEWLEARRALLEQEKAFTRQCDEMSRLQRSLPWERVTKEYTFEGADGRETLADLFAGRSQLVVYHFMFHPDDMTVATTSSTCTITISISYPKGATRAAAARIGSGDATNTTDRARRGSLVR